MPRQRRAWIVLSTEFPPDEPRAQTAGETGNERGLFCGKGVEAERERFDGSGRLAKVGRGVESNGAEKGCSRRRLWGIAARQWDAGHTPGGFRSRRVRVVTCWRA